MFKRIIVLCCAVFAAQASVSGAPRSPNIIFFLVDDLGWPDVGCYGSSFYETPAIDQMAKEGRSLITRTPPAMSVLRVGRVF